MHDFKEWLSDNLRYFIVGVVVILIIGGSILGIRIYSSAVNGGGNKVAVIDGNTEKNTEKDTEKQTETVSEKNTEKQTESASEKDTEKQTESGQGSDETGETGEDSLSQENTQNGSSVSDTQPDTQQPETVQTEAPQPETVQTEPPEPVYLTLNGACYMRSYPDYGDNIIGEYSAGTTVEFLADVGGWYEVSVDGRVGYIGARFFY